MIRLVPAIVRPSAFIVALMSATTVGAGPEEGLIQAARIMYLSAENQPLEIKRVSYENIRKVLDQIVTDYPASDIAVSILLKDTIDGVDISAIDATLASLSESGEAIEEVASDAVLEAPYLSMEIESPQDSVTGPLPRSETDEGIQIAALPSLEGEVFARAEKEIVADVQAELNRIGCNAGGADGVVGRRTKSAFNSFVQETGSNLGEDELATENALAEIKAQTGRVCKVVTMASTPASQLGGSWGFRSECPGFGNRVIKNSGTMRLKYTNNQTLRGTARNQQGIQGPATIQFQGKTAATIIKFGFVTVKGNLSRSTRKMSISGTGSANCKIVAWKN